MKCASRRECANTSSSKTSRAVFMRTAATALIAASPFLYSGIAAAAEPSNPVLAASAPSLGERPVWTGSERVRDLLAVPMDARVRAATISPSALTLTPAAAATTQVIDNANPISVTDSETAIPFDGGQDHVTVTNSGDLVGGQGIDISTGAFEPGDVLSDTVQDYLFGGYYHPLYDDAGNRVLSAYGYPEYIATVNVGARVRSIAIRQDAQDATLSIANSGKIDFAGSRGISARNPAGESIDIDNSGAITSTGDGVGRAGIYASTDLGVTERQDNAYVPPVLTYNSNGQVTGVTQYGELITDIQVTDQYYDGGTINIVNSGNIDMGDVAQSYDALITPGPESIGIFARGDGGTTIHNSGDIKVSHHSTGIQSYSTGEVTIVNDGDIEIGNLSYGIMSTLSDGSLGDYRIGGDVYVLNTGDISGGITKAETVGGIPASAAGIVVDARNSNNEYYAAKAHLNEIFAAYNEQLGEEVYELFDTPKLELFTSTAVNEGRITLKDGGRGIAMSPWAGESVAINRGTIIVGDGTSIASNNAVRRSAGIHQSNFAHDGLGTTISVNAAGGIIVTGDDSAGMVHYNIGGSSYIINEGSITTGDGLMEQVTNYAGTYDRLFQSAGIISISAASATFGTISYAQNTGEIAVGRFAIGSLVSGQLAPQLNPYQTTGLNNNEGIITTGDNSTGMLTVGTNVVSVNSGSVTIGDLDLSAYTANYATADEFAQQGFGVASTGHRLASVINDGTITTGDGTVGAAAFTYSQNNGLAATVSQGEDGVITTGDQSTGILARATYYAAVSNDGVVTVGHDSVGVETLAGGVSLPFFLDRRAYAGGAYGAPGDPITAQVKVGVTALINSGIIETGDNSVGVNLQGAQFGVEYSGQVAVLIDDAPYYYYADVSGTVDVVGGSYLRNTGTIRVGANSTAVAISGQGVGYLDAALYNTGTIEAGAGSTAISINQDNTLGAMIINGGTIIGDIHLGDGDDMFLHAQNLDANGQVLGTGNIVMNDNRIDFGDGNDRFVINGGQISVVGGAENLITGENLVVEMINGLVEARDAFVGSQPQTLASLAAVPFAAAPSFSTLTIDGDVSGSFSFAADVGANNESDLLIITGDVAPDSTIGIVLNPVEQLSGEFAFNPINIGGTNNADSIDLIGLSGDFADSLVASEVTFDAATGNVIVSATFGMGHLATAVNAATAMGQNWLARSFGSSSTRGSGKYTNRETDGLSFWAAGFQDEGTINPANALQDVSFRQIVAAVQLGADWSQDTGAGRVSIRPMVTYGTAEANLNANVSSARSKPWAIGLNANFTLDNGLYFDAVYQRMQADVDLRTPQITAQEVSQTKLTGQGFDLEAGYAYKLKSGLTLEPQVQFTHVSVDLDDLASGDGIYGLTDIDGKGSTLRAGVNVYKIFATPNGSIAPLAGISYLNALDGESRLFSNGVEFASDTSGSGYRGEVGVVGRYKTWDLDGRIGIMKTGASGTIFQPRLTVRYSW